MDVTYKKFVVGVAMVAGVLLVANPVMGAYLLDYQDGETVAFSSWTGGVEGDSVTGDGSAEDADLDVGVGVGGHANALGIDPSAQGIGENERDYFFTTPTALGTDSADISGYATIRFDFFSSLDGDANPDGAPALLGAYFHSTFGGGDAFWFYTIGAGSISSDWTTYDFGLSSASWLGSDTAPLGDPTGMALSDALTSVDEIGFMVAYVQNNSTQIYGVDDFGLTVPEPETYLVLGMALLSIAVVFRKRISDSLADARAMMHA